VSVVSRLGIRARARKGKLTGNLPLTSLRRCISMTSGLNFRFFLAPPSEGRSASASLNSLASGCTLKSPSSAPSISTSSSPLLSPSSRPALFLFATPILASTAHSGSGCNR